MSGGGGSLITACTPQHAVAGGENLSVNNHDGLYEAPIAPGMYSLHQTFTVSATHLRNWCPGRAVAEFGSDSELDKTWLGPRDPFAGASKKDFGFKVTLKVVEDAGNGGLAAAPAKTAAQPTLLSAAKAK